MKVAVVGAANIDITSRSNGMMVAADSNPGKVVRSAGGVGRNIAFALKALGFDVTLITAVADDVEGRLILEGLAKAGIRLGIDPFPSPEYKTGIYSCIIDGDGSFVCAVNDMEISQVLSPELILEHREELEGFDYVVFEANLSVETIKALSDLDTRLVADCVSSIKAPKLVDSFENLYLLKANFIEACTIAGIEGAPNDTRSLDEIMHALVSRGLKRAIISLGKDGAFCYEVTGTGTKGFEAKVLEGLDMKSTNGCGDVLLAAFLRAMSEGCAIEDALCYGQAASGINSESMEAVSPALSYETVKEKVERHFQNHEL